MALTIFNFVNKQIQRARIEAEVVERLERVGDVVEEGRFVRMERVRSLPPLHNTRRSARVHFQAPPLQRSVPLHGSF